MKTPNIIWSLEGGSDLVINLDSSADIDHAVGMVSSYSAPVTGMSSSAVSSVRVSSAVSSVRVSRIAGYTLLWCLFGSYIGLVHVFALAFILTNVL